MSSSFLTLLYYPGVIIFLPSIFYPGVITATVSAVSGLSMSGSATGQLKCGIKYSNRNQKFSNKVVASGRSNASDLKIEIKSGMNIPAWRLLLKGYRHEKMIIDGLAYGWPLNWTCSPSLSCQTVPNHPTAEKQFPALIKEWYLDQVDKGMLVGTCQREDLPWANLSTIPLQSVVKDPVEMTRRICADPTYSQPGLPEGFGSLNQGIPKNSYLLILYVNTKLSFQTCNKNE